MNVKGNKNFMIRRKETQLNEPLRAGDACCGFAHVTGGVPSLRYGRRRLSRTQEPLG